ncbi:MAG: hypothetical protein ACM3NQ_14420, partial [Bacteroidales bacterium]
MNGAPLPARRAPGGGQAYHVGDFGGLLPAGRWVMSRLLVFLIVILAAVNASAQSLAEVAKKEEARRKEVKAPAKVLTNDDLKKYNSPPPATSTAPATPTAQPGDKAPAAAPEGAQAGQKPPAEPEKNEAWWRNRITEVRAALERNKLLVDSLQTRANAL